MDWSEIIAAMFAATLDQLFIDNQENEEYLPIAQADALREARLNMVADSK